jgi:hypothetical protein
MIRGKGCWYWRPDYDIYPAVRPGYELGLLLTHLLILRAKGRSQESGDRRKEETGKRKNI